MELERKRRRTGWLATALVVSIGIAVGLPLPSGGVAMDGLDPANVRAGLAIFTCIALLWMTEALPLAITAIGVAVLACGSGLMDTKSALAGFADPLIFLFFGGFALASALSAQGLDRWIARKIVHWGRGDFLIVSYLMFGATALISMWVSNTATTAMMLPLALGILRQVGDERGPTGTYLLLGIAYSASVGGIGTLVGSPPNGIAAAKLGIGFIDWMKFGVPTVLVLMPLLVVILKRTCRPENAKLVPESDEGFVFTRERRLTLAIFAVTATCWIFSVPLAKILGIKSSFDTMIALVAVISLASTGVIGWKRIDEGTDWGVLLLFGGGITLSSVLGQSGASLFAARLFAAQVSGWPGFLIIGAVILFIIFLTELTSNTALAALMVPIFYSIAREIGMPAVQLVVPLAIAASCSFMLPVGTPPNALVFATGRVPQPAMIRVGLILNLSFTAALMALAQWLF